MNQLNRQAARTAPWPFLPEDLRAELNLVACSMFRMIAGETMKFIIGQRPLSKYNGFLDDLEEAGVSRLLELLNSRPVSLDFTSLWAPFPEG